MSSDTLTIEFVGNKTIAIPNGCFRDPIKYIIVKDGFEILHERTFFNFRNLINISLPASLTTIKNEGFFLSSYMQHLFLPKNVQNFDGTPFDLSPIAEFEVDKENKYFCSLDGVIFTKKHGKIDCLS